MKSKKAIKRLTRVEKLLAEVQSHYSALEKPLGKLLLSAKASVEGIKDSIAKSIKAKPAESKVESKKDAKGKRGKKKAAAAAKAQSDRKVAPAVAQKRPAKRAGSRMRKSASAKRPTSATSDAGMDAVTIAS